MFCRLPAQFTGGPRVVHSFGKAKSPNQREPGKIAPDRFATDGEESLSQNQPGVTRALRPMSIQETPPHGTQSADQSLGSRTWRRIRVRSEWNRHQSSAHRSIGRDFGNRALAPDGSVYNPLMREMSAQAAPCILQLLPGVGRAVGGGG